MFVIDKANNKIDKIESKTFNELGFKEREHLQEWIAKNPLCLGDEELLIIQKEFNGFNETNERLDLLALDKYGALVIIENKLDDTGKDVNWQVLKYVSYCSTLTGLQIVDIYQAYLDKQDKNEDAKEKLGEFFNKPFDEIALNESDQRIILVARNFRKEVTSTAMWMINHGITVQCFKATPYKYGEELLLDIEQIIPVKEAQDYMIKMADKMKESESVKESNRGIEMLRKKYWGELLEQFKKVSSRLFKNVNPSKDHWLSSGSGVSGITFTFVVTTSYANVELSISKPEAEINKEIYDKLFTEKDVIEKEYGQKLFWQRLDEGKSSRISVRLENVSIRDIDCWERMKQFHCDAMVKFYNVIHDRLKKAAR